MSKEKANIQMQILNKLMFVDSLTYGKIQKGIDNHDLFNHHLKELVRKEYLDKNDATYSLTTKGRQYVAHMEEDGTLQQQFKVSLFIDVMRVHKGKHQMLVHRRLKHPHYGYIGSITCKLQWGDSIEDNLVRELYEEIKIKPLKYTTLGVVRETFLNEKKEKVGDGVYFVIVVDEWEGTPEKKGIEGEYFWHDIDDILNLDPIFRSGFEHSLPYLQKYLNDPENYTPYIDDNNGKGEALKY